MLCLWRAVSFRVFLPNNLNILYTPYLKPTLCKFTRKYLSKCRTKYLDNIFVFFEMAGPFYAVGRGRNPGVFKTWLECEQSVKGIANAKYRKFGTKEEALKYVQDCKRLYSPYKSPTKQTVQENTQQLNENLSQDIFCSYPPNKSITVKRNLSPDYTVTQSTNVTNTIPIPSLGSENNTQEITSVREDMLLNTVHTLQKELQSFIHEIRENFNNLSNKLDELASKVSSVEEKIDRASVKFPDPTAPQQNIIKRRFHTSSEIEGHSSRDNVVEPLLKVPKVEIIAEEDTNDAGNRTDFNMDEDGYVIVYTDGACENNGKKNAKAGIGVWFGDNHYLNCSEPVQGRPTNNVAEIEAAAHAVEMAKRAGVKKLAIYTDSEFMINCITKWMPRWKKNNWKVSSGGDVKNKDDLIILENVMKGMAIKWEHVRGHQGIHGNEMADTLARQGARMHNKIL